MSDQDKPVVEFPKWVVPHNSHIETSRLGHQVPQGFIEHHWDRVEKQFTVLVTNADEEARALAPKVEPSEEPKPEAAEVKQPDPEEFY